MVAAIDYDAFREEVREFALTHCPPEIRAVVATYRKLSRKVWYPWQKSCSSTAGVRQAGQSSMAGPVGT